MFFLIPPPLQDRRSPKRCTRTPPRKTDVGPKYAYMDHLLKYWAKYVPQTQASFVRQAPYTGLVCIGTAPQGPLHVTELMTWIIYRPSCKVTTTIIHLHKIHPRRKNKLRNLGCHTTLDWKPEKHLL